MTLYSSNLDLDLSKCNVNKPSVYRVFSWPCKCPSACVARASPCQMTPCPAFESCQNHPLLPWQPVSNHYITTTAGSVNKSTRQRYHDNGSVNRSMRQCINNTSSNISKLSKLFICTGMILLLLLLFNYDCKLEYKTLYKLQNTI